MAKDNVERKRITALKVFVLVLKCAFSRRNSKECFLGCIGYVSGSESPKISIEDTLISTLCPFP